MENRSRRPLNGSQQLDASLLLLPQTGFLPFRQPVAAET
jgi:hypothetical protein